MWHTDSSPSSRSQISKKDYQENWCNSWHLIKAPRVSSTLPRRCAFTHRIYSILKIFLSSWRQALHILCLLQSMTLINIQPQIKTKRILCVSELWMFTCIDAYAYLGLCFLFVVIHLSHVITSKIYLACIYPLTCPATLRV